MLVYFSVLIIICLICLFDNKGDGKRPLLISVGLIYLMITLQEGWGGDSEFYISVSDLYYGWGYSLDDLMNMDESERHGELGYKIMFTILPSYRIITFICAAVLCFAVYVLVYNFIPRKYWYLFFILMFINKYMLMGDISALPRNGLAASIFLLAVYFLSRNKKIPYLVLVLFGALFHKSILVFLPFVFVPKRPLKIHPLAGVLVLLLVAAFSAVAPGSWGEIISTFLSGSDYLDAYSHYLDENAAHFDLTLLVPFIIFWGGVLFYSTSKGGQDDKNYFFLNFAIFTIAFRLLPGIGMSDRLFFYMDYCMFAGLLIACDKFKPQKGEYFSFGTIVIISILFVYGRWFLEFSRTPHFIQHWMQYNPIFNL